MPTYEPRASEVQVLQQDVSASTRTKVSPYIVPTSRQHIGHHHHPSIHSLTTTRQSTRKATRAPGAVRAVLGIDGGAARPEPALPGVPPGVRAAGAGTAAGGAVPVRLLRHDFHETGQLKETREEVQPRESEIETVDYLPSWISDERGEGRRNE